MHALVYLFSSKWYPFHALSMNTVHYTLLPNIYLSYQYKQSGVCYVHLIYMLLYMHMHVIPQIVLKHVSLYTCRVKIQ